MQSVAIVDDLPLLQAVDGHTKAVPFLLTKEMFGGIPLEFAGAEISALIDTPVAEPHVHQVPEIYLLFSVVPGEAEISVTVEDEVFTLVSPGALYVPAGKRHQFVTKRAATGSYCFGVFLHPGVGAQQSAAPC
jgi:hypothetical protein